VLFSRRIRDRVRFSVLLVSCYAHVFVLLSIVIVTLLLKALSPKLVCVRLTRSVRVTPSAVFLVVVVGDAAVVIQAHKNTRTIDVGDNLLCASYIVGGISVEVDGRGIVSKPIPMKRTRVPLLFYVFQVTN